MSENIQNPSLNEIVRKRSKLTIKDQNPSVSQENIELNGEVLNILPKKTNSLKNDEILVNYKTDKEEINLVLNNDKNFPIEVKRK